MQFKISKQPDVLRQSLVLISLELAAANVGGVVIVVHNYLLYCPWPSTQQCRDIRRTVLFPGDIGSRTGNAPVAAAVQQRAVAVELVYMLELTALLAGLFVAHVARDCHNKPAVFNPTRVHLTFRSTACLLLNDCDDAATILPLLAVNRQRHPRLP